MANMGYCRFTNTLSDLHDCNEHLYDDDLTAEERKARRNLIKLCGSMAAEYDEDMDKEN